jgi:hypothetical protein
MSQSIHTVIRRAIHQLIHANRSTLGNICGMHANIHANLNTQHKLTKPSQNRKHGLKPQIFDDLCHRPGSTQRFTRSKAQLMFYKLQMQKNCQTLPAVLLRRHWRTHMASAPKWFVVPWGSAFWDTCLDASSEFSTLCVASHISFRFCFTRSCWSY